MLRSRANTIQSNYTYDGINRLTLTTEPATSQHTSPVTTNHYDQNGNLDWVENARGFTTSFAYDVRNNRTTITQPGTSQHDSPVTIYRYDTLGQVKEVFDPLGNPQSGTPRARYRYDSLGRQVCVTEPQTPQHAAPVTGTEYYADGRVKEFTPPSPGQQTSARHDYGSVHKFCKRSVSLIRRPYNSERRYRGAKWGRKTSESICAPQELGGRLWFLPDGL